LSLIYLNILYMALVDREGDRVVSQDMNENSLMEAPKMWLFTKLKYIFVACIAVFVIWTIWVWFYTSTHTLFIDNPTWSGITLQIGDMETIEMAAFSNQTIKLWAGIYSVSVNWEKVWDFEKKSLDTDSLLNPTDSIYITEYILYWDEEYLDKLPNNTIEAYGNVAEWPFDQYSWLYIVWDWDYWINEQLPEEVELRKSSAYKIKSKLYRFDDFVDMYNEYYAVEETSEESVESK